MADYELHNRCLLVSRFNDHDEEKNALTAKHQLRCSLLHLQDYFQAFPLVGEQNVSQIFHGF